MFTKLLKHEWRASRGILGALSMAALGTGILGAVLCRILFNEETMRKFYNQDEWISIALVIVLMFLFFALIAYAVGSELLLLHRFYKSKFTDEGYLTFTLPVSSRQIFLATFANMSIWMIIITVVVVLSFSIMIFGGISGAGIDLAAEFNSFSRAFTQFQAESSDSTYIVLNLLSTLVSFISSVVIIMTCVTLGSVLAKKHKLMAAFGIYYLYSMVYSVAHTAIISTTIAFAEFSSDLNSVLLIEIGIQSVLAVGSFFLSTYLMEKKLNLP